MQKENWQEEIKKLTDQLDIKLENYEVPVPSKDQQKRLKKKFKKYGVDEKDTVETATEKTKKMIDQLSKNFENLSKQNIKVLKIQSEVDINKTQKDKAQNLFKMADTLHKGFEKKYKDILQSAKNIEKQQEDKRKALIEQLQNRIKIVQEDYESAGKVKIEKFRENQTLKHQISRLEPQLVTTQSLYDAQLKKKELEVEIQMTTLKQKIEMMNNFRNMSGQTKEKIEHAEVQKDKLETRLKVINQKQDQHKILLTKAHLILEDYKRAIKKINDLLGKKQREALQSRERVKKAEGGIVDIDNKIKNLEKEEEQQKNQIQMLLTLEENLKKQFNQ